MTLAPASPTGQAFLVPCRADIADVAALILEATALWDAEKRETCHGKIGASWGCVGVLFRSGVNSGGCLQDWAKYFSENAHAISPVDQSGVLQIPWPTMLDGAPADVDLILAIAVKAEATCPGAKDIADAWLSQNKKKERYFFENVRHGIRTPEDGLIWRRIEEQRPYWIENSEYADAVALLRREAAASLHTD